MVEKKMGRMDQRFDGVGGVMGKGCGDGGVFYFFRKVKDKIKE